MSNIRLRYLLRERDIRGCQEEAVLSIYRDLGVVPKSDRSDNYNKTPQDLSNYKLVLPGDVVVNKMKAWQGSVAVSAFRGIVSGDYLVCAVTAQVDRSYLHHMLRSPTLVREYGARARGVRPQQWRLYWDDFADIDVVMPSLQEQARIGRLLDAETARIDELIAKKWRLISLLEERICTEIDEALAGFRAVRLKYLVEKIGSGKTPTGGANTYESSGIKFIRSQNVLMGRLNLADVAFIAESVDEEMASTRVQPEDVLLNITGGSIGRCAVVPSNLGPANVNQHVCIIRPIETAHPQLLHYAVRSTSVQSQIREGQAGGNRDGLNFDQVGNLQVHVPIDKHLQKMVADGIAYSEGRVRATVNLLTRQIALLQEHRQAFITHAVTGQPDIPGAAA